MALECHKRSRARAATPVRLAPPWRSGGWQDWTKRKNPPTVLGEQSVPRHAGIMSEFGGWFRYTRLHDEKRNTGNSLESSRDIDAAVQTVKVLGYHSIVLQGHSLGTLQVLF